MIMVGILVPPIAAAFQPKVVVEGARRTPVPHEAPTGSEASISAHTASRTAGWYWSAQPTWRSQLAMNSLRDCVLKTRPVRQGRRRRRRLRVLGRREQHHAVHLVGMLRGIAAGARPACDHATRLTLLTPRISRR